MLLAARPVLAGLFSAFVALAPTVARASCADPVRVGDVVSFVDLYHLRRFDLATGTWLQPVELAGPPEKVRFHGDTIWGKRFSTLMALDATGAVRFELPFYIEVVDFDVRDGHVFVLAHHQLKGGRQVLLAYDAETGELESETGPTEHQGVIAAPGRVVLHTLFRFDAATYDESGRLGSVGEVYRSGTFHKHIFRMASDGAHIVADPATFDAATLEVAEGYEGTVPTVWGDRLVTVMDADASHGRRLRLYDAARSWVGERALAGDGSVTGLFPFGGSLWAFGCGQPAFDQIEIDEFTAPPPLPAPLPAAELASEARSYATGEEGLLYFLTGTEPHVRRWLPDQDRILPSIPLRETPRRVVRAQGGGVYVLYESGRVGRIERDGEAEVPFVWVPRDLWNGLEYAVAAGPWTMFSDGSRLHAYSADGRWRDVHYDTRSSPATAWDAARSRVVQIDYPTWLPETLVVDDQGRFSPGAVGAEELRTPLVAAGDRLFAGFWIADIETLERIAELDFVSGQTPIGTWSTPDTLVTLAGSWSDAIGPAAGYQEWTADGSPLGAAVTIPGVPVDLLPYDAEHVVLVRAMPGQGSSKRTDFLLIATGGDLDSDGVHNDEDDYPIDSGRYSDRDGDGVDDDADAFPDDPTEISDEDGDGLGDVADHLPDLGAERIARLSGEDWVGISGLGRSDRDVEGQLHVFADGRYAFCTARETCLGGAWQTLPRNKGLGLTVAADFLTGFGQSIQAGLARDLDRKVSFRFLAKRARGNVRTSAEGAVRFTLRAPHRGSVAGFGPFTGAYRIRAEGEWLELGAP